MLSSGTTRDSAARIWFARFAMVSVLGAMLGCGCVDKTPKANLNPIGDPEKIKALEQEVMLDLPDDVALARTRHNTIVKPCPAWTWLFYSKSGFTLDSDQLPGDVTFVRERDVSSATKWIQSLIPRDELPEATGASFMVWDTEEYQFRVELLVTKDGQFLSVQRFRQ